MTWGEIEDTPFRLDGSDTPLIERTHGPAFKVPTRHRNATSQISHTATDYSINGPNS